TRLLTLIDGSELKDEHRAAVRYVDENAGAPLPRQLDVPLKACAAPHAHSLSTERRRTRGGTRPSARRLCPSHSGDVDLPAIERDHIVLKIGHLPLHVLPPILSHVGDAQPNYSKKTPIPIV